MTFIKVIIGFLLTNNFLLCDGQFLTPDQLRQFDELSYGARTHYDMTSGRRTDMFNRLNPDYLLRGFFPFWSLVLISISFVFLGLAAIALIGYYLGCRRPTLEELYGNEFEQMMTDDEFLLGTGGLSNLNDTKISIQTSTNGYLNHHNNQKDFQYESLLPMERTHVGRSNEHMV